MSWPEVAISPVVLPRDEELIWSEMLDLADALPEVWTLIGGLMVRLYSLQYGGLASRPSLDIDALVDARRRRPAGQDVSHSVAQFVQTLVARDFVEDGESPDGVAHRYLKGEVLVDVLAPDGLKDGGDSLRTQPPRPSRTVQVPGGTQALQRTEWLPVLLSDLRARVPRPNLLGAVVIKARAVDVDDVPMAQLGDVVRLLNVIHDPVMMATDVTKSDRRFLGQLATRLVRHRNDLGVISTNEVVVAERVLQVLMTAR